MFGLKSFYQCWILLLFNPFFLSTSRDSCDYTVNWEYPINESVAFVVTGKVADSSWIGIGFNKEKKQMFGTDIILGYFDKSIGVIKEFYAIGELRPKEDKSQEIFDTGITKKDGRIILEFKRKLKLSSEVSFSMPTYLQQIFYLYIKVGH